MQDTSSLTGIILAAGKGTRMNSPLPKVLHKIAGLPMLERVVTTLQKTAVQNICVVLNADLPPFQSFLASHPDLNVCIQGEQNGTGGAVAACSASFGGITPCSYAPSKLWMGKPFQTTHVLICAGDCPALSPEILSAFVEDSLKHQAQLAFLGMELEDSATGYGRLVLAQDHSLKRIVEEKDAVGAEKNITICNSGVVFAEISFLFSLLQEISPKNAQSEYYLTDCAELAASKGRPARVYLTKEWRSFLGVNTPEQLHALEQFIMEKEDLCAESSATSVESLASI